MLRSTEAMIDPRDRPRALQELLYELEVRSEVLRRDPRGLTWLSPNWQTSVQEDPRCQSILDEYVRDELELFDSVRERADALFTSRVVTATASTEILGAGTDPMTRTWILASAYAVAVAIGCGLLSTLMLESGPWTGTLHALLGH